jgi:hypothetical protein
MLAIVTDSRAGLMNLFGDVRRCHVRVRERLGARPARLMTTSLPSTSRAAGRRSLLWLPGHVRVGGAAFMLQDRYDSVGGEIKIAVRVGM